MTTRSGKSCWDVFRDGYCDEECNTKECLFDGRDCDAASRMQCNPVFDGYCSMRFSDGRCVRLLNMYRKALLLVP